MATFFRPNSTSYIEPNRFRASRNQNSQRHCCNIQLRAKKQETSESIESSQSENVVLKAAWYGSELLGIAASFFRPDSSAEASQDGTIDGDESKCFSRAQVVDAVKKDFERSYFVTAPLADQKLTVRKTDQHFSFSGVEFFEKYTRSTRNLTLKAYEDDCEFADPAGSFRGLKRFKRNCSNFGSLLEKSSMNLMKWEDHEDKSIGHWRFSCVMSFPWRPILSATGYTEYYFDAESGRICRHVEHWNVPKMALLKQIFRPSRWVWEKR